MVIYVFSTQQEVKAMANQRQKKIERFKQQKKTEQQLKELRQYMEKDHVEDETKVSISVHTLVVVRLLAQIYFFQK